MNDVDIFLAECRTAGLHIRTDGVDLLLSATTMPDNALEIQQTGRRLKWQIIDTITTADTCAGCGKSVHETRLVHSYWGPAFCSPCNVHNVEIFDAGLDGWPPPPEIPDHLEMNEGP